MKTFLTTTAAALVLGTSAFAETHTGAFADLTFDSASNIHASEMIGMRVYASEAAIDPNTPVALDGAVDWNDIGEINEIVLTRSGDVQAVIVGVGGFLGLGEKDVAVDMSQIRFLSEDENPDDYFLVIKADTAGVQDAPSYEYSMTSGAPYVVGERVPLTAPEINRDGYSAAATQDLTTEDLTGARVYGPNDEDVGEISELLLTNNGNLDRAIIDVGGFLGLGEHPVAVTLEELTILRTEDGNDFRVYIDSSQDTLEAQPKFES
ncbi:PRC-barrel domain containing protein [Loktanella sp. D2R18]|uniref:PRC-barrel domain-containing protein n=1 Tax=Rhodobacterales TaxID=204455 RepID=UPI000DEA2342|nr:MULTISPECIES: PRC-barrel domain-containing protein [Rhodobacterales]MDO6590332.1 PRC-barrel domain-containing protein [Yoonia sp. 1_MG-2023]RBW42865.1 PRC-barrel domain containing protein [Loktanella sp. D2R18]